MQHTLTQDCKVMHLICNLMSLYIVMFELPPFLGVGEKYSFNNRYLEMQTQQNVF